MIEKYGVDNAESRILDVVDKYGYFHILEDSTIEKSNDKAKQKGNGWEESVFNWIVYKILYPRAPFKVNSID